MRRYFVTFIWSKGQVVLLKMVGQNMKKYQEKSLVFHALWSVAESFLGNLFYPVAATDVEIFFPLLISKWSSGINKNMNSD